MTTGSRHRRWIAIVAAAAGVSVAIGAAMTVTRGARSPGTHPQRAMECSVPIETYDDTAAQAAPPSGSTWALSQIADTAGTLGLRHEAVYTGLVMDGSVDRVYVWRIESPASAEFDRDLQALPGSDKIEIRCAPYTQQQLLAWLQQLRADAPHWKSMGLLLHEIGPRPDGICLTVGTEHPDRAEQELRAAYPEFALCFTQSGGSVPF